MNRKTRTILIGAFVGAIAASGLSLGYRDLGRLRQAEGYRLRTVALYADDQTLDRLNQADGLRPGREFSIDDYCGTQCRPDSIRWSACVDSCVQNDQVQNDQEEN